MARRAWQELRPALIRAAGSPLALARREEAVVQRLLGLAQAQPGADPERLAQRASLLDLAGRHAEAQALLQGLGELPAGLRAAVSLLTHMVRCHVLWEEDRNARSEARGGMVPVEILSPEVPPAELRRRFLEPGVPCVLRGCPEVAPRWGPLELKKLLGDQQVPTRRCEESSGSWARLEFVQAQKFKDFCEAHIEPFKDGAAPRESPQLFDFSIWQHCADTLGRQVSMPSQWFPVDLYTYAGARIQPVSGSAGPTLFLAPKGSGSSLHVDTLQPFGGLEDCSRGDTSGAAARGWKAATNPAKGSAQKLRDLGAQMNALRTHFWMAMCHGRKRWRLVSRDDISLLHPMYLADLNPVFPADLNALEETSPGRVKVHEVVLEPGDLIFVPAGWPHQVDNLETSVAVSANFIDPSNLQRALDEADLLALVEEEAQLLGDALRKAEVTRLLEEAAPNEPLRVFKARHGETRAPQEIQRRLLQAVGIAALSFGGLCLAACWPLIERPAEKKPPARQPSLSALRV
ncbi:unnamed protein product [Effrenium voratum]|uniref:JmjC domain-containing protein n=1 Tax=Effrenium voratum TaxID=2562239 RepID=A0AA36MQZ9_9DINO|nr:unnamed protein product [Effrenium voratum]CAJ1425020.1 unnamed protein product [Effrenium voratum]